MSRPSHTFSCDCGWKLGPAPFAVPAPVRCPACGAGSGRIDRGAYTVAKETA